MSIKLVTFDALGTLVYLKAPPPKIYAEIATKHNIVTDATAIARSFKTSFKKTNDKWPNFGSYHNISSEKWWKLLLKNTLETHSPSESILDSMAKQLYQFYSSDQGYQDFPFVKNMLQGMKKENIQMGVISNTDERLHGVLKSLELYKFFDFVLTSKQCGIEKPKKEIFEHALQMAGVKGTLRLYWRFMYHDMYEILLEIVYEMARLCWQEL
jgi:putative hydrolase of the HAD superfamily